jgi:hypothetical protein
MSASLSDVQIRARSSRWAWHANSLTARKLARTSFRFPAFRPASSAKAGCHIEAGRRSRINQSARGHGAAAIT